MKHFERGGIGNGEVTLALLGVKRAKEAIYRGSSFKTALFVRDIQCLALAWIIHIPPQSFECRTMEMGQETQLPTTREVVLGVWGG
jgi:hypothetical protein